MRGVVIAGTHSGCGKTTVTLGILAALGKKGLAVQSFKTGPDFIDSGLHRLITGRPSRNLDVWMCGRDYVCDCFFRHSQNADVSVIEGVMGMYDGAYSTASLAQLLGIPVILVVDAYGMAESAGALVKGFSDWGLGISKKNCNTNPKPPTPGPCIAGVIFNRIASEKHFMRVKESVQDIPVLGYLPRDLNFEIPHRHLGLSVAEEEPISDENIEGLADAVLQHIDVDRLFQPSAVKIQDSKFKIQDSKSSHRIAVAYDKAFCFYYEDNLDLLKAAGMEIARFSPLSDTGLPENIDAVYIGGGYPELYAQELSGNEAMLDSIKQWSESGKPLYAECGGLMYLSQGIHDFDHNYFKMAGLFPFETQMKKGRSFLGYRELALKEDCIIGRKGDICRGHEFHYSGIRPGESGDRQLEKVYTLRDNNNNAMPDEGFRVRNTLASYVHVHFGSNPAFTGNLLHFIKEHTWKI